jgi:FecR protein
MIRTIATFALVLAGGLAPAAELKEARVTEVVRDVKLLPTGAAPRPATVSDEVRDGTAVRTGAESRSELKFPDQTLARLGANTVFSFNEGTRSLNLQDGAMLLRVPKGAGGAKISSSAVTAAITGTTVMLETHPLTQKNKTGYYKFIVLEGTARLSVPGHLGESILVKAGQMIIMPSNGKVIPQPVEVDIGKIMQSSLLITGFGPLGSEPLIAFEQTRQSEQKTSGRLFETNLMIAGGGTNVIVGDPNKVDVAASAGQAAGSGPFSNPTPTPTPTATPTPTPSGTPSKFGTLVPITSPNPYVITSGTTITTDPSITTNGVTDYGKIWRGPAVDGPLSAFIFGSISAFDSASGFDTQFNTSGAGFKFNALQLTGNPTISTTNGEVNLGLIAIDGITSGQPGGTLTFAGISGLLLATQNGSINLGSEISFAGLHDIDFYARGAGSALSLACDVSTSNHIRLYGEGAILVTGNLSTQVLTATAGATISIGQGTINASEALLLIPNSGSGNIPGNAAISLQPAGNLALNGPNGLSLTIDNTNGGQIGQGAQISINAGDVNASSFTALIDSANGGSIGSDALNIVNAANIISDGFLDQDILTINGGHIHGNALELLNVTGNITGKQGILGVQSLYGGGQVDGSAIVTLNAQNITTPSTASGIPGTDRLALEASIYSNVNGRIGNDAIVSVVASQSISAPGTAFFTVANGNYQNLGPGTIGGNAEVDVGASTISTGDFLPQIYNYGGASIGGHAQINVAAASLTVNGMLNSYIDNSQSGTIGSDATIDFSVSGITSVSGDATFEIFGSDGAKSAAININNGNYTVAGNFLGSIDGNGTFTLNNASIAADTLKVGVFGTNGTLRIGGGTLAANTLLHLYAPSSNGIVDFVSNVTLNCTGSVPVIAANTVTIENGVVVTIGGSSPANVFTNVANYSGRNGGNNSTTGIFAGAGATTQPLGGQPPFAASNARVAAKQIQAAQGGGGRGPAIHVTDSSELAALLDNATPGSTGKVRVSPHQHSRSSFVRGSTRISAAQFQRTAESKVKSAALASRLQ